jgi:hypothetical protein
LAGSGVPLAGSGVPFAGVAVVGAVWADGSAAGAVCARTGEDISIALARKAYFNIIILLAIATIVCEVVFTAPREWLEVTTFDFRYGSEIVDLKHRFIPARAQVAAESCIARDEPIHAFQEPLRWCHAIPAPT